MIIRLTDDSRMEVKPGTSINLRTLTNGIVWVEWTSITSNNETPNCAINSAKVKAIEPGN